MAKKKVKARRYDGLANVDITIRDGVSPVVKKKRVPLSQLDEVLEELKRKFG